MSRTRTETRHRPALALLAACLAGIGGAVVAGDQVVAAPSERSQVAARDGGPLPRSPELSESRRLDDRRAVVIGERAYATSTEDGLYPAMGFHTRGEMGGIWSPPIKLLDGIWFGVGGRWLGGDIGARRFSSGWGYARTDYAGGRGACVPHGLRAGRPPCAAGRTDASQRRAPDGLACHCRALRVDGDLPLGRDGPEPAGGQRAGHGERRGSALVFREQAGAAHPLGAHDWAAVVGSSLTPVSTELGPDFRGPQDPAVICPASGTPDPQPERCDDTDYGAGTGGELQL